MAATGEIVPKVPELVVQDGALQDSLDVSDRYTLLKLRSYSGILSDDEYVELEELDQQVNYYR